MLKYVFTIATLLDSKSRIKKHYSSDTIISSLFINEKFAELDDRLNVLLGNTLVN